MSPDLYIPADDETEYNSSDYDDRSLIADILEDPFENDSGNEDHNDSFGNESHHSQNSNLLNDFDDHGFQRLSRFLGNNDNNETITECNVNVAEILLAVLKYSLVHSLTQTAIANLFEMLNVFFGFQILPDTRYLVDKMFSSDSNITYHALCPTCGRYVATFDRSDTRKTCIPCNLNINLKDPTYNNFFAIIDVKHEIASLLQDHSEYYEEVVRGEDINHERLNDITDGRMYKRFVNSLPIEIRNNYATVMFNSDGSPTFRSSKFSVWPIQLMINELPFQVRISKSVVCSIWFGKDKPRMDIFLKYFVSYMNELSVNGVRCRINDEDRNIRIFPITCTVDSVARAPMQGSVQYNGRFGCNWCLHPGVYVRSATGRGGSIKYIILEQAPLPRTELSTYRHMRNSITSAVPIFGIKSPSWLINLQGFNIVRGFVPDSMHCINLGIAEQFMQLWLNTHNMDYSMSHLDIDWINQFIQMIKVPNQIERSSRSIKERKFWKSMEYENWVLYYFLVVLLSFPHMQEAAEHWALLVEAYYLLLKESITYGEVNLANDLLKRFVVGTEVIYSEAAMTFNIHQLLHLCQSVADWGPLWAHFGYGFENGNGTLLKKVQAAKGVIYQICRYLSMNHSALLLKNYFAEEEDSRINQFVRHLEKKSTGNTLKFETARYFGAYRTTDERWIEELHLSEGTRTYQRMVKDNCLFASLKRPNIRTDNSFALTRDDTYIRISDFLVDVLTEQEFTICQDVTVENIFNRQNLALKRVIDIPVNLRAIATNNIDRVCVFMEVGENAYISAVPNNYYY